MQWNREETEKNFVPLKPQRLLEEVYRQLKEAILEGHYKPGDRLPSEQEFCKAFGVGRPVIREAFRFLENSGLIKVKPGAGGGSFVQKIDASILLNTFEGIVRLDGISKEELHEARVAFEIATLPLVMDRIDATDIEALEANIREVKEDVEKGVRRKRNIAFHILLFKASRNQLLIKIGEALFALMDKLLDKYEYSEERSRTFLEEHTALVEILKAGDLKKAQQEIENHIRESINYFH
jgi:GntR family transcriptional repressor for pyruvate dehydrogenase complex